MPDSAAARAQPWRQHRRAPRRDRLLLLQLLDAGGDLGDTAFERRRQHVLQSARCTEPRRCGPRLRGGRFGLLAGRGDGRVRRLFGLQHQREGGFDRARVFGGGGQHGNRGC
jgi:hypothetical protein